MPKFFRPSERDWRETMNMENFQRLARFASGQERPYKDIDDKVNKDWGMPVSPRLRGSGGFKERKRIWSQLMEHLDCGPERLREWVLSISRGIIPAGFSSSRHPIIPFRPLTNHIQSGRSFTIAATESPLQTTQWQEKDSLLSPRHLSCFQ